MKLINKHRTLMLISISVCFIIIGFLLAVSIGVKTISLETVWKSIVAFEDTLDMQLVRDTRIPRAICTILAGGLLAVTGSLMQGVTRNPISEPSFMGITQGAMLAISIVYAVNLATNSIFIMQASFIGALISGILVLLFSLQNARNANMARLLLAGVAISTFFTSLASMIALLSNKSQFLAFWISGGFRTANWQSVQVLGIVSIIGMLVSLLLASRINILQLGEEVAIGLGQNPVKTRVLALLIIIPICAAVVSVAGNISFVGLLIPQIVKRVVGQDYRKIIPCSFLLGGVLLVFADILARMVNSPYETPIGLFTAILGVPFFLYLVRKETK